METKKSYLFGMPMEVFVIVVLFILGLLVPVLTSIYNVSKKIDEKCQVITIMPTPEPTPSATPSASVSPATSTLKQVSPTAKPTVVPTK